MSVKYMVGCIRMNTHDRVRNYINIDIIDSLNISEHTNVHTEGLIGVDGIRNLTTELSSW